MSNSFISESYVLNATSTDVTGTEPASSAENDLIIALVGTNDNTGAWTDPADFTEIDQVRAITGDPDMDCYIGYKKRGATAGNGYQWTYSGAVGGCTCTLITLRGQDLTTPEDVTYVSGTHFNDGTVNTPNEAANAITTITDAAWVVLLQLMTQGISGAAGPPSGYTERADNLTGATTSRGSYVCTKEVANSGVETPGSFTHVDVTGTSENRTFTIAIRPASGIGRLGGIDNRFNTFIR